MRIVLLDDYVCWCLLPAVLIEFDISWRSLAMLPLPWVFRAWLFHLHLCLFFRFYRSIQISHLCLCALYVCPMWCCFCVCFLICLFLLSILYVSFDWFHVVFFLFAVWLSVLLVCLYLFHCWMCPVGVVSLFGLVFDGLSSLVLVTVSLLVEFWGDLCFDLAFHFFLIWLRACFVWFLFLLSFVVLSLLVPCWFLLIRPCLLLLCLFFGWDGPLDVGMVLSPFRLVMSCRFLAICLFLCVIVVELVLLACQLVLVFWILPPFWSCVCWFVSWYP